MGWAIGEVGGRDVGYGVPATCDYPTCKAIIDRGVSYVCGDVPGSTEFGCGLFFCGKHLGYYDDQYGESHQACDVCRYNYTLPEDAPYAAWKSSYEPKPDRPVWIRHKLRHGSWKQWRDENPDEVRELQGYLENHKGKVK